MNKSELTAALREHLAGKESIANEAAPALKLMRYALVELEKPTSNGGTYNEDADALRKDLASSERYVKELVDALNDREGYLYALLAEARMVPEVGDEPVGTLGEALERAPTLLDDLQEYVTNLINDDAAPATSDDKDRFINGVRELLDNVAPNGTADLSLQALWSVFETASRRYASLEEGMIERDRALVAADARLLAIRSYLQMPVDVSGDVNSEEIARMQQLMSQAVADKDSVLLKIADAARAPANVAINQLPEFVAGIVKANEEGSKLLTSRFVKPEEEMLEAILRQCIKILRLDWQDVETLPQEIQTLKDAYETTERLLRMPMPTRSNYQYDAAPFAGWVSDAIDLAHAVRGNIAPENRVMAKAAEAIIAGAPRGVE